jgi:hypothetical protein
VTSDDDVLARWKPSAFHVSLGLSDFAYILEKFKLKIASAKQS